MQVQVDIVGPPDQVQQSRQIVYRGSDWSSEDIAEDNKTKDLTLLHVMFGTIDVTVVPPKREKSPKISWFLGFFVFFP